MSVSLLLQMVSGGVFTTARRTVAGTQSRKRRPLRKRMRVAACVLIIDDEPLILEVYSTILSRKGYDVLAATEPRQAIETIRSNSKIDVVISDVVMPQMRGTDLVREVARLAPATSCILITAFMDKVADVPPGVPLLRKPLSSSDLISAVESAIARAAALHAKLRKSIEPGYRLQRRAKQLVSECQEVVSQSKDVVIESRSIVRQRNRKPDSTEQGGHPL